MKRLILLVSSIFFILQTSAQNNPHPFFFTSHINGSIKNDNGSTSRSLSFNPSINYMINKQLAIGFFVDHKRTNIDAILLNVYTPYGHYTLSKENTTKIRDWYLGPQIRYYHSISRKLYFLVEAQGGVNFEIMKTDYTVTSTLAPGEKPSPFPTKPEFMIEEKESKDNALFFQAKITPGIVYFLDSKVALELKTSLFDYTKIFDNYELPSKQMEEESQTLRFKFVNTSLGASLYF